MWLIDLFIYFAMSSKNLPYIQDESCILSSYWWMEGEAKAAFVVERRKVWPWRRSVCFTLLSWTLFEWRAIDPQNINGHSGGFVSSQQSQHGKTWSGNNSKLLFRCICWAFICKVNEKRYCSRSLMIFHKRVDEYNSHGEMFYPLSSSWGKKKIIQVLWLLKRKFR